MSIGAVILAAGAGTRLGGVAKALLRIGERTYLQAIADTLRQLDETAELVVVVGAPFGDDVGRHARELGARVVVNPDPARGMASSIAVGFAAIAETDVEAAFLWPVDHPAVRDATLHALWVALRREVDVTRPVHGDRGGHPPLIAPDLFAALARCDGVPGGARDVIAAARVGNVVVEDRGVIADVDSPADAETLA